MLVAPAFAAEPTLDAWAENIEKVEVQQEILNEIFPGQIGPASEAKLDKASGRYLLPKNNNWVRLGKDVVWSPAHGRVPAYLAVTAMFYNKPEYPTTGATYLFRDAGRKPTALSAGYAGMERVQKIELPMLKKTFLLITGISGQPGSLQWTASMLEMRPNAIDRPKTTWQSPAAVREFQLGFDYMGGAGEMLLLRTRRGGETQYIAFSYEDGRFERDDFVFDTRLMTLPESTWKYVAVSGGLP